MKQLLLSVIALVLLQNPSLTRAPVTIDTSNPTDWKISNGIISVDWLPNDGRIFSIHWSAFPNQEIIDQTNRDHNGPKGFYMDNVGPGGGTPTNNYYLDPNGKYIDWWVSYPSGPSNPFTWSHHRILFALPTPASTSTSPSTTAPATSPAASARSSGYCEATSTNSPTPTR